VPGFLRPLVKTEFPDGAGANRFKGGSDGLYWVEIAFQPQPFLQTDDETSTLESGFIGDSHLIVSDPLDGETDRKHCFTIDCESLKTKYYFYCNIRGRLSHVNIKLVSKNIEESVRLARYNLEPFLSGWAARFNVPIYIFRTRVLEELTGVTQTTIFHQLYPRIRIPEAEISNKVWWYPDDTRLLDLYREALNTTSPKYQFLCYFAAIHLAFRIRKNRSAIATEKGDRSARKRERFDEADWFSNILTAKVRAEVIGKKLTAVYERLRPLRNQIAHALVDEDNDESVLISDDHIYPYLPVAKRLAERLLSNELGRPNSGTKHALEP
jgi:hypothetical protein